MKDKLPKIGLLIGSLVLFVFISEILLVFAGFNYYPVDIDVNISEKDRIFRLNKTSGYYETDLEKLTLEGEAIRTFPYQKFKAEKEPGTYRIFVLGGSSVYILADDHPEYAKKKFETFYPDKKLEIIFAGGLACGTYELKRVNQEVLEYEPDLIILYSGHNEFIIGSGFMEKKYYFEQKDLTEIINENLEKFRLYQLLSNIILPIKNSLGINNEIIDIPYALDWGDCQNQTERQIVHDNYRLNIENMIRTAKNKNVDFMVSTVSYNHIVPPVFIPLLAETFKNLNITPVEEFQELTSNYSRKKMEEIVYMMINQDNIEELNEYRIGLKYYEEGQFKKAKEHFEMAIILECFPLRANNITNRMVRELAKEYDIPLADVETAVLKETENNITTYEQFNDHCHLKSEGNEILLDTFLKTIKENHLIV